MDNADYNTLADRVFAADATFDYSQADGPVFDWSRLREADMFGGNGFDHNFHLTSSLMIDFTESGRSANCYSKTFEPWATTGEFR